MDAGAGQYGTDRQLRVSDIEMQLIAAPVLLQPLAALLGANVALLRQIGQHSGEFLMALPHQAGAAFPRLGFLNEAFGCLAWCDLILRDFAFCLLCSFCRAVSGDHERAGQCAPEG